MIIFHKKKRKKIRKRKIIKKKFNDNRNDKGKK